MNATPVRLDDYGDVMTERDLCALMQWKPNTPRARRDRANALRVHPDLPEPVGGWRQSGGGRGYRYTKWAVEAWLRGETTRRVRRAS